MKYFLIAFVALMLSIKAEVNTYTARITYYSTDKKWGNKVACTKTKYAKEGVTIAAHPNFKFGTKVYIPALKNIVGDGIFIVQDRGVAVTEKVASRNKSYVFDVYVTTPNKVHIHARNKPEYMKIYIIEP